MDQAAAEETKEKTKIDLNMIIMAGLERGLTIQDIRELSLGRVVDFVIDYNKRRKDAEEKAEQKSKAKHYRLASKNEVDAWLKG